MIKNIDAEISNLQFQLNLPKCINRKEIENRLTFLIEKKEKNKLDAKQFMMDFYTHDSYPL